MQQNAMGEKKKMEYNGEEIPGLVNFNEIAREKAGIEVPSYDKSRTVSNGVSKIPVIELVYRVDRGTKTQKFFEDWYDNNEVKDATMTRTDAHGDDFKRVLLPSCECLKVGEPAYDAGSPEYAKINVTLAPWDYIPLAI